MQAVQSAFTDLLHLFFPHNCAGCGSDILEADQLLCLHCLSGLPSTNFFHQPGNPVEKNFYGRVVIEHAAAAYFFTKDSMLQNLLNQFKYRGKKELGSYLGKLVGIQLLQSKRFNNVDAIVPLPLNPRKERRRGFNQALELCKGIAEVWPKPIIEKAVARKVFTETQTHKGRVSRWENMEGVFEVTDPSLLTGKHILLVDDVVTSGATLEACGTEILNISGTRLSLATLAYTI